MTHKTKMRQLQRAKEAFVEKKLLLENVDTHLGERKERSAGI